MLVQTRSHSLAANVGQRWLLWLLGLVIFLTPLLAPSLSFFQSGGERSGQWQLAGEQTSAVQGAAFASDQGLTTLYRWSPQAVWRSADQGHSWTIIGAGLPTTATGALALVDLLPGSVHTLYALAGPAGRRGLYRSTDSGAQFDLLYQPLDFNPALLAVQGVEHNANSSGDDIVALAGGETLVISLDGGATWRNFRTPGRTQALAMTGLGLWAVGSDGVEYNDDGLPHPAWVAHTVDNGDHWQLQTLPDGVQPQFLAGANRGPVDWYLGHARGLLASSDEGVTWQSVRLPAEAAPTALVLDPLIWQMLVLADASGKLWRSDDAGVSWQPLPVPTSGAIRRLFLAPGDRDRLYAVAGFDLWWLPQTFLPPTPTGSATPTSTATPGPTSTPTLLSRPAATTPVPPFPSPSPTFSSTPALYPTPTNTVPSPATSPTVQAPTATYYAPTAVPTDAPPPPGAVPSAVAPPPASPTSPPNVVPTPAPTPIPSPTSYR